MQVDKIQNYVTPKTTGYFSAGALSLALLTGINKQKSIRKMHKPFAWLTAFFTAVHIGLIEYYNYKYRNK